MNIVIRSAEDAFDEVHLSPRNKWHVISLRDHDKVDSAPVDVVADKTVEMLVMGIDDLWLESQANDDGFPTREHLERILAWVKIRDRRNLLVHCTAGVSRSASVAFLIACTLEPPEVAIKRLDVLKHFPNEHIMKLGSEILDNPRIHEVGLEFLKSAVDAFKKMDREDEKKTVEV